MLILGRALNGCLFLELFEFLKLAEKPGVDAGRV
jgi:hypothetical protein